MQGFYIYTHTYNTILFHKNQEKSLPDFYPE